MKKTWLQCAAQPRNFPSETSYGGENFPRRNDHNVSPKTVQRRLYKITRDCQPLLMSIPSPIPVLDLHESFVCSSIHENHVFQNINALQSSNTGRRGIRFKRPQLHPGVYTTAKGGGAHLCNPLKGHSSMERRIEARAAEGEPVQPRAIFGHIKGCRVRRSGARDPRVILRCVLWSLLYESYNRHKRCTHR